MSETSAWIVLEFDEDNHPTIAWGPFSDDETAGEYVDKIEKIRKEEGEKVSCYVIEVFKPE
jgi:hypothetical protein